MVQKAVGRVQGEIMKVADQNEHTIDYLLSQPRKDENAGKVQLKALTNGGEEEASEHEDMADDGEGEWIGLE